MSGWSFAPDERDTQLLLEQENHGFDGFERKPQFRSEPCGELVCPVGRLIGPCPQALRWLGKGLRGSPEAGFELGNIPHAAHELAYRQVPTTADQLLQSSESSLPCRTEKQSGQRSVRSLSCNELPHPHAKDAGICIELFGIRLVLTHLELHEAMHIDPNHIAHHLLGEMGSRPGLLENAAKVHQGQYNSENPTRAYLPREPVMPWRM